jgi:hypothetical protein
MATTVTTHVIVVSQLSHYIGRYLEAHVIVTSQLSDYIDRYLEAIENIPSDNKQLNATQNILEARILPTWKQYAIDRSAPVRKTIIKSLRTISLALPNRTKNDFLF